MESALLPSRGKAVVVSPPFVSPRAGTLLTGILVFLCLPGFLTLGSEKAGGLALSVTADRVDGMYQKGEKVSFAILLEEMGRPVAEREVKWSILRGGGKLLESGTTLVRDGQAVVSGTLEEPGFLLCNVSCAQGDEEVAALSGAAIAPLEIAPSQESPPDFDAFWKSQLARLAGVPKNFQITPVKSPNPIVEAFDLQAGSLGAPVSGYFARPDGAKPKSRPAILTVHGAGVRSAILEVAADWAGKGFLALDINAHGLPNGQTEDYYATLARGELSDYRRRGWETPDSVYFAGMFLRLIRAIDFLAEQPEWDGKTMVVFGGSQGGAQAIAAAALDPRVSFFVAGVPALCDHTGYLAGRAPGWPKFVHLDAEGKPDARAQETARFIDMVNMASRVKAPGVFTVGFIDTTCPPAGIYAAYNRLPGQKDIHNGVADGHSISSEAADFMQRAVMRHREALQ